MGYHISVDSSAPSAVSSASPPTGKGRRSVKVGSYGSQTIMMALWFAAYAVADRPDSKRAAGFIEPIRTGPGEHSGVDTAAARHGRKNYTYANLRNRPVLVRELLATNDEDAAWLTLATSSAGFTFDVGRKFRPFSDPDLDVLAVFYDAVMAPDPAQSIPADGVAAIAPILAGLVPYLSESCWFETMSQVSEVFDTAASSGAGVSLG